MKLNLTYYNLCIYTIERTCALMFALFPTFLLSNISTEQNVVLYRRSMSGLEPKVHKGTTVHFASLGYLYIVE